MCIWPIKPICKEKVANRHLTDSTSSMVSSSASSSASSSRTPTPAPFTRQCVCCLDELLLSRTFFNILLVAFSIFLCTIFTFSFPDFMQESLSIDWMSKYYESMKIATYLLLILTVALICIHPSLKGGKIMNKFNKHLSI